MIAVFCCPLILSESHILKSFHTKSWIVRDELEARPKVDWVRAICTGMLRLDTDTALGRVDRKWIVLGREGRKWAELYKTDLLCK